MMTLPGVTITELDGALGVLPPSAGRLLAVVGPSSDGPLNLPATYARTKPMIETFGAGPLVEAAALAIEKYQKPIVMVRTGDSVAGTVGAVNDDAVSGTAVVTVAADEPVDDLDVALRIVSGGTVGTAGITYQTSVDGGNSWSTIRALGTAVDVDVDGAGVSFELGTGTLLAGDTATVRTTAPAPSAPEVTAALEALRLSTIAWEIVHVVSPVDATTFDAIEAKIQAMAGGGKYRSWIGSVRMPNAGESAAAYQTAMSAAFSTKATRHGSICAGDCDVLSSVSGAKQRRPPSFIYAPTTAAVSEEINVADPNLGPLVGVSIRDMNGNPLRHDEAANPGLDDARFVTLRTHDGLQGVYVTRPLLLSPAGSDYQLLPHRRVLNLGNDALRLFFLRRLNSPILVDKSSGFILEQEALEIEAGANAILRSTLLAKPKASNAYFVLSRTDNLLSTRTLTGDMRIVPLSYPEQIQLSVGFVNPALVLKAA